MSEVRYNIHTCAGVSQTLGGIMLSSCKQGLVMHKRSVAAAGVLVLLLVFSVKSR